MVKIKVCVDVVVVGKLEDNRKFWTEAKCDKKGFSTKGALKPVWR